MKDLNSDSSQVTSTSEEGRLEQVENRFSKAKGWYITMDDYNDICIKIYGYTMAMSADPYFIEWWIVSW